MPLYEKAFWVMSFFLLGVLTASIFAGSSVVFAVLIGCLLILLLALLGRYSHALCAVIFIIGALYYPWRVQLSDIRIASGPFEGTGMVEKIRVYPESQTLTVSFNEPEHLKLSVTTKQYPSYVYGDLVQVQGQLKVLPDSDQAFQREGIQGRISFPVITVTGEGGNSIRKVLFSLRDSVAASFSRSLPPEQSTFMTGLTLGKSAAFSDTLREEMKITGTTHLVALSGYNVSIIGIGISFLLGLWFSRRAVFPLSIIAIALFVLMTGAEASVVRAAIMAIILLVADRTGRLHSVRNAITAAAFLMVLINPRVLAFDIGFQLSFFAFLGIVYLKPALDTLLFRDAMRFEKLRFAITTTLAAQLAVLPLLLSYFGFASLIAIIPNLLIIFLTPVTMLLGLLIFLASLLSSYFALLVALPARLFLGYELWVIHFFAQFKIGVAAESLPVVVSVGYYLLLVAFILFITKRRQVTLPL